MPPDKDLNTILGLSSTATADEIRKAYHKASRVHHPDKSRSKSTPMMQEVNNAWEVLSDTHSRAQYDAKIKAHDSCQNYCASCTGETRGNCPHQFNFKPAHSYPPPPSAPRSPSPPPPPPVCKHCGNVKGENARKSKRISELETDIHKLKDHINSLKTNFRERDRIAMNNEKILKQQLRDLQGRLSKLAAQKNDLEEKRPKDSIGHPAEATNEKLAKVQNELAQVEAKNVTQSSTIQRLNDELKALKAAGQPESSQSDSKMKDELVLKDRKITELEKSNKVLRGANTQEKDKLSKAQKALKTALDNETATRKENERLAAELETARLKLEQ
ncbi:unnamed protein product [Aureobasidium vineae]|uniref:J domain-containing protein n=1 Tax=Aureobasidium vineae TaxID=2773715 RepID=A0A9N8PEH5_9PEZI|nr:unnamed protein product [Aureobasidium vineae]